MNDPFADATALVPPTPLATRNRRANVRYACDLEALSRPLESTDIISWGSTVVDVAAGGIGLILCYPFKLGTFLTVDLESPQGPRTYLVCVARVTDRSDGTWLIGCEFTRPLSADEVRELL